MRSIATAFLLTLTAACAPPAADELSVAEGVVCVEPPAIEVSAPQWLVIRQTNRDGGSIAHAMLPADGSASLTAEEVRAQYESDEALTIVPTPPDSDLYALYAPPGDVGFAAVHGVDGTRLFAGGIVWNGRGGVVSEGEWIDSPSFMPDQCLAEVDVLRRKLVASVDFRQGGAPMDPTALDRALQYAAKSPLVVSALRGAEVRKVAVVFFPPDVGRFNPWTAEWVTLLSVSPKSR